MTARTLAAAALVALIGTALAQPNDPARADRPAGAPIRQPAKADPKGDKGDLAKQLAARVNLEKYEGKFKDAVTLIADTYNLPLVLTKQAAERTEEDQAVKPGDQEVTLPRLTGVKVETVLALLCEQTETKYLVGPDCIKIVPDLFAWYETGVISEKNDPTPQGDCDAPFLTRANLVRAKPLIKRALVNASFKNKPFSEAIDEIVEATGANVAVSPLLPANVRQTPITVRFANTPVDAVVRTLCEMTESGVIEDANVLLVTTRERVAARAKEELQKAKDREPAPRPSFNPGLGGFGGFQPQPTLAPEIAALKEQNEQLKKQVDQLEKLVKKLTDK